MTKAFTLMSLLMSATCTFAAEPCVDNFSVTGNMLVGSTYKTTAKLQGVRKQDAFSRALTFTAENGFTIISSDKEAGVISAAQSISYGKGKTVPLNVVLSDIGADTRIAITYATSTGVSSPEDAIKRHFCMTLAAAADSTKGGNAPIVSAASNQTSPATKRATPKGFAVISEEQQQAIVREISKLAPKDTIGKLVSDAAPAIASFVERLSCLIDYTGASALNEYAAPGVNYLANMYSGPNRPMGTQYHDKAHCMTVIRVQGWKAPANNALSFEVTYKADDSGEVKKFEHESVKQSDGLWLFTR